MRFFAALLVALGCGCFTRSAAAEDYDELFQRLDANRDGFIEKSEIGAANHGLFERLTRLGDGDRDGKLTLQEFRAGLTPKEAPMFTPGAPAGRPNGFGQGFLVQFDRNRDGKISREEAPPPLQRSFDRIDADGDGLLDFRELRVALLRRMQNDRRDNRE